MNKIRLVHLFLFLYITAPYSAAWGDVVAITNSPSGFGRSQINSTDWKAMLFSTSSRADNVTSIQVGFNCFITPCSYPQTQNVIIDLYSVQMGVPNALLYSLGLKSIPMDAAGNMYTLPIPNWNLRPNTTYALVLKSDLSGIGWANTLAQTSPTSDNGYVFQSFKKTSNSGASWTDPNSSVNAVVIFVTPASSPPQPIPTLSEWAQIIMVLAMITTAGLYGWRLKYR